MGCASTRVNNVIVNVLGVEPEEVKPESFFVMDLGADSIDQVELVMDLEKEFGISIPDEEAERLETVSNFNMFITKIILYKNFHIWMEMPIFVLNKL